MWLAAAEDGGASAALIAAIWTFLGIVVTTLGTIAVSAMRNKHERRSSSTTSAAPPSPTDATVLISLAKEQGILHQRADDSDERDDYQDRRLDRLERWAEDQDPPGWK